MSFVYHSSLSNFVLFSREIDVLLSECCDENNQNISCIHASMSLHRNAQKQCYYKCYQIRQMR